MTFIKFVELSWTKYPFPLIHGNNEINYFGQLQNEEFWYATNVDPLGVRIYSNGDLFVM